MRLLAAIVSIFLASTATAATYYVSATGNDASTGSIDAPFRTIKGASRIAKGGDIVNVRGGTYTEASNLSSKGTASARIVFRAMPGENVILDGSSLPSGTAIVTLNATEYVDFSGFEVRNSPYIGIVLWNAKNTRVLGNHVHHATRNGIYAGADAMGISSDITVSDNSVHDTVLENQYHNMSGGGWAGAVVVSKTERATITGNRIWNNDGEGLIALRTNNAVIRNNEISDCFSVYLYLDNARFISADSNLLYSTGNTRYYRAGLPGTGIGIANETKDVMNPSSDNVFTNNIVIGARYGFYYGNYESGGGLRNTKVLHNTFYRTVAEAIRIEDDAHANNIVQNNIIDQTGSPTPKYAGGSATVYRSNLWYGGIAGPATGTGDLYADPMFVRAGGLTAADYKLRPLSPAAQTAAAIAGVANDYFGQTRTPATDIGAHEQSSGTADVTAPTVPTNVRATGGDSTSVTIAWDASTDNVGVTAYVVIRNGINVASVNASSWTDRGVTANTTYQFQVQSVDAAGNRSAVSSILSIAWSSSEGSTPATPMPVAPAGVAAVPTETGIRVTWTAPAGSVASYRVYRDGAYLGSTQTTFFNDTTVTASTTYRYQISTRDTLGNESPRTAAVSVTTNKAADRNAPSAPAALSGVAQSAGAIELTWKTSTDDVAVVAYNVYRNGQAVASVGNGTSYIDSGLNAATAYTYHLVALDAAGNQSPPSAAISVSTKAARRRASR